MRKLPNSTRRLAALALTLAAACSDSHDAGPGSKVGPGDDNNGKSGSFESDLPASAQQNAHSAGSAKASDSAAAPEASGVLTLNGASNDATRAIVEADVIQLDGTRLYALSRIAGLTIVDLTDPAHPSILGRYRELNGQPFEMYLRDGVVLAMYSSWGQYVKQADNSYSWVQTSKVVALDVGTPSAIKAIGSFDVPGEISDSRIVGDVMYVVGYQNGYCWNCDVNKPQTTVLSLNVKDPKNVGKVDQLAFADAQNSYGWSKRSITVTDQRMYVAGPEYGVNMPTGSTIQVVDISDPTGDLVMGATVQASGQISSRWQMNEYQGVLRVISQIPQWWNDRSAVPSVQTFTVASSQTVTALASAPLTVPYNDTLQTVQFDGPRGYAVTAQQTDPLITIDLGNPAQPRQVGSVQMPGYLYYLAARGDRIIGLGYDQGNAAGGVTVSIVDVTDMSAPKLLDRVNFGGTWASLPEDQDRIQKAFRILDDVGLILVPFSGWGDGSDTGKSTCYSRYHSGTQLVDLNGDDLVLRGAAPSRGEARRAFLQSDKLITFSDEALDTYDISNRDQPAALGQLDIARNVTNALPLANGTVARIDQSYYESSSTIELVNLADVERSEAHLGSFDMSQQLAASGTNCVGEAYVDFASARGNQINVSYQRYDWNPSNYASSQVRGVLTVDASDPSKPTLVSKLEDQTTNIDADWYQFYSWYNYGYSPQQQSVVRTDTAIVYLESRYVVVDPVKYTYRYDMRLRVIDLTDPAHPSSTTLALPQGDSYGGLVIDGNDVMVSHYESTTTGRARFYIDRIDLSTPSKPKLAAKVNVPGSLMHYDRAHGRALTSELVRTVVPNVTSETCYARFAYADFATSDTNGGNGSDSSSSSGGSAVAPSADGGTAVSVDGGTADAGTVVAPPPPPDPIGTCTGYIQKLHLVTLDGDEATQNDTITLADGERISSSSLGDSRVAAIVSHGWQGWYGYGVGAVAIDCWGPCYSYGTEQTTVDIMAIGGFDTGTFASGRLTVNNVSTPWWGFWGAPPVFAEGTRALVQSYEDAADVDLTDPTKPTLLSVTPLYATSYAVSNTGNTMLLSLGQQGVQRIDL